MAGQKRKAPKPDVDHESAPVSKKSYTTSRTASTLSSMSEGTAVIVRGSRATTRAPKTGFVQLGRGNRTTRSQTHGAAAHSVFNTTELLEKILVHLPCQSIIISTRVCHQFKETVNKSIMIQEKLFLRVHGKGSETWRYTHSDVNEGTLALTSDIQDVVAIPGDLPAVALSHNLPNAWPRTISNYIAATKHNSLLYLGPDPYQLISMTPGPSLSYQHLYAGKHLKVALQRTLRGHPISPVLYSMHLTDPAPAFLKVWVELKVGSYYGRSIEHTCIELHNPNGCSIGMVLEAIRDTGSSQDTNTRWWDSPQRRGSAGNMAKDGEGGNMRVVICEFRIKTIGVLLPSEEDRKTYLVPT